MYIDQYYNEAEGLLSFTRQQGSDFAKGVAEDFNPLHDIEARRFVTPGDLLFAIMVARYGVSQKMEFAFSGMVSDEVQLRLPEPGPEMHLEDANDKRYLSLKREGELSDSETLIENLTLDYVKFSGHTFPDVLVPLLAEQGVMINPARPMVMYQSMAIDLERLDIRQPVLESDHVELELEGKRGSVRQVFNFLENGEVVGHGYKSLLVSGLLPYDKGDMDATIATFNSWKRDYQSA